MGYFPTVKCSLRAGPVERLRYNSGAKWWAANQPIVVTCLCGFALSGQARLEPMSCHMVAAPLLCTDAFM